MKCSIQKTCTKLIYWRNLVMNDNAGPTCFYSVIVLLNNKHSSIFHATSSIYRYTIHKKLWSLISGIYNRLPEQGLQRTSTSRRSRGQSVKRRSSPCIFQVVVSPSIQSFLIKLLLALLKYTDTDNNQDYYLMFDV
jgi:hypothetical protein